MFANYDQIVIGAGIVGSCAALALVKRGQRVLLLEQFPLPHTRGSSHGHSRLIRTCYSEDFFARMMGRAFQLWTGIENDSGLSIINKTGVLCLCKEPFDELDAALINMRRYGTANCDYLDHSTMEDKYPFITYDMTRYKALMDATGGVVKAGNALRAVQTLFVASGGRIIDSSPVTNVVPGDQVTVTTAKGQQFTAASIVICCGPWTGKLLQNHLSLQLPLTPQRVNVFYFREKKMGSHSVGQENGATAFLDFNSFPCSVYGMPTIEYPGLIKVCAHFGVNCDPDRREQTPPTEEDRKILSEFIAEHLTGLESEPAIVESCMYTVTPDESFIIDTHPRHNNIVIGAGFSGTGFKLAPLTGSLLADLAMGTPPSHDLQPFLISRFTPPPPK